MVITLTLGSETGRYRIWHRRSKYLSVENTDRFQIALFILLGSAGVLNHHDFSKTSSNKVNFQMERSSSRNFFLRFLQSISSMTLSTCMTLRSWSHFSYQRLVSSCSVICHASWLILLSLIGCSAKFACTKVWGCLHGSGSSKSGAVETSTAPEQKHNMKICSSYCAKCLVLPDMDRSVYNCLFLCLWWSKCWVLYYQRFFTPCGVISD